MNATMKENKTMTPRQRLERWETELRLARRRRQWAMEAERPRRRAETLPARDPAPVEDPWAEVLPAEAGKAEAVRAESAKSGPAKTENIQAAVPAEAGKSEPVKAEAPKTEARKTEVPKGRSHKLGRKARAVREGDGPVVYAPVVEKSAGKEAVPAFTGSVSEWMAHVRLRLRSIRREEKVRRFPESNRLPVQLLLFARGMLPMLGSHLRERKLFHRRSRISRTAGRRPVEHRRAHTLWFLGGAAALILVVGFFSFFTVGTVVSYDGQELAKVGSLRAAKDAASDLERRTSQALGGSYTISESMIRYASALLPRSELVDESTLEEELSDEIGLVTFGYGLYVDDELIGATPYEGALEELQQQLKYGVSSENTISCDFREEVEVKEGYYPTEKIMNLGYLAELLYSTKDEEVTYTVKKGDTWSEIAEDHGMTSKELLAMNPGYDPNRLAIGEVLTLSAAVPYLTLTVTEQERYVADIPYDVAYTDSADLYKGDYKVTSAGVYGKADVVANVTYTNGEETERTVLSYTELQEPVTEQRLRGTKERPTWLPTGSFRWPASGSLTSRFGGRKSPGGIGSTNHKGIDIANRRGTPIYAADGGTVIYAGWMSGYGYLVQISHGNGIVTYYGHNSSLLVSVGQHVYKGQQIAKMGSTGNSTGNHCHFEIRVNGVAKNPLNYLP